MFEIEACDRKKNEAVVEQPSWNSRRGTAVVEQPSWNSRRGTAVVEWVPFGNRSAEAAYFLTSVTKRSDIIDRR
jgi:hypothetical protein